MSENKKPKEVLDEILADLRSADSTKRFSAVAQLHEINYGSEAICNALEKIVLTDASDDLRKEALFALNLPAQRNARAHLNKIERGNRYILLSEIESWEKNGLLKKQNAEVIRRRYDFDFIEPSAPKLTAPKIEEVVAPVLPVAPQPATHIPQPTPPQPATLTETLLSETSVKIALYLGAFFVIASGAILAALTPAARLPVLIVFTILFGGISIALRKRLPQPSFTLFIIFSFLLPITAGVLADFLKLPPQFDAAYWVFISAFMALIWAGGVWIYESRLFSLTAIAALTFSFYRIGDMLGFHIASAPEFYATMLGLAALAGLSGAWTLKQWMNAIFAEPLFISVQLLQVGALSWSVFIFFAQFINAPATPLWNLSSVFTWTFAFAFFALSDILFPFILFPWIATGTLFAIPWLIGAAFELDALGGATLFFVWGLIVAASSEVAHQRFEQTRKYSLPVLLVSILITSVALIYGFMKNETTGFVCALGVMLIYAALHFIRPRSWVWAFALLSFSIAYFAFFKFPSILILNIFFGYKFLGLSVIFLLPDFFLKNDFKDNPAWRLPPRIYGAAFTALAFLTVFIDSVAGESSYVKIAIMFGGYALLFAAYALRYNAARIGYVATLALTLSATYALNYSESNFILHSLAALSAIYFFGGFALRKNESRAAWRTTLEVSGLTLGSLITIIALFAPKDYIGGFIAVVGAMFVVQMDSRKQNLFEMGAQTVLSAACYLVLKNLGVTETSSIFLGISLVILSLDALFTLTLAQPSAGNKRPLDIPVKAIGGLVALLASLQLIVGNNAWQATIGFAIYTVFFIAYAAVQRKPIYAYLPAAYLPLTIFFALKHFNLDVWLPALTGLAILYFAIGYVIRNSQSLITNYQFTLRNSALILGTILSFGALITFKETGGWYALVIGLLFAAEMYLRRDGWFEIGLPAMFSVGAFLILRDFNVTSLGYRLLALSFVWLLTDLLAHLTFTNPRPLMWIVRGVGAMLAAANYATLFFIADSSVATIGFGAYALLFLTVSLVYRRPNLLYAFTLTLPLFATFLFRVFDLYKWIHPVIVIAVVYYVVGFFLRRNAQPATPNSQPATGWDAPLLYSGLGIGVLVSIASPILGGLDAAIPVAFAATMWAAEALARKNVWLGFPANGLYLLAYFIILVELKQTEPQFFSMGAAALGMFQHYLLTRAESKTGAFITGMVSQFALLGSTYTQMILNGENGLTYFVVIFFQSIAVIFYGVVIRSRSLTFVPIGIVVISVITVLYSALKGISAVVLVGCSGILLIILGVIAVVMRERISKIGERVSDWKA